MKISTSGFVAALVAVPALLVSATLAQDFDPPDRVARIAYLSGSVSLQTPDDQNWNAAPPNYPMISGDRLYTDEDGRAAIQNGSIDVRMGSTTDATLTNLTDEYEQVGLAQGSIRVRVYGINPGNSVEVDTPNGAVIIQQAGDYRVNVYPNDQGSLVQVTYGSVQITGEGVNQEVDQGQAVQLYGSNPVEVGAVEMPPLDDLDNWSLQRDQLIINSQSARYVSREMPGYEDLDGNGDWSSSPDYGPVWYPRGVPMGWAPYTTGRWAYVAPWGYTWIDDSPWGYAPFHYGRWAVFGGRWGWVPGPPNVRPVYSPALVAFVGGGGFGIGITAWFPLGVAEPYVPWYRCSPTYVRQVNVTNVNITVIRNTTVINNYNTFITNTRNVTTVNDIHVNNVTYANRNSVYAVNSNAFASGGRVQQGAVRLNPQQRQQLVSAPLVVARPPAAAPAHSLLQARPNVTRPSARPVLMTTSGRKPATPAANSPTFKPAALPKPQPAAVIRPAPHPITPNLRPAAPNGGRPGTPATPANPRPVPQPENRPATPQPGNRPVPQPHNEPAPPPHNPAPPPPHNPPPPPPPHYQAAPPPRNAPPPPPHNPPPPPPRKGNPPPEKEKKNPPKDDKHDDHPQ